MYNEKYDHNEIRKDDSNFFEFIKPYLSSDVSLIDLGCGTCRKVVKLSPYVKNIVAIDRNEIMLECARKRIRDLNIGNIHLYNGDNMNTPFTSYTYDICTTSLSVWSAAEAHRLLKPQGLFFIETLASDDKFEIKRAFGMDNLGYRGYLFNQDPNERLKYLKKTLNVFFDIHKIKLSESHTTLSKEGFINLLEVTPTIRNFSLEKDLHIINSMVKNGKVSFTEKRIMIMATTKELGE